MMDAALFREWLVAHRDEFVGRPSKDDSCPLANWLQEQTRVGGCLVNLTNYIVPNLDGGETAYPLPEWAKMFVKRLDSVYKTSTITGRAALIPLDTILERLEATEKAHKENS